MNELISSYLHSSLNKFDITLVLKFSHLNFQILCHFPASARFSLWNTCYNFNLIIFYLKLFFEDFNLFNFKNNYAILYRVDHYLNNSMLIQK